MATARKTPKKQGGHQIQDEAALKQVRDRLRRAEGQIRGVIAMIDEGKACHEIVTQLNAASKALDRAAFLLISTGLRECLLDGREDMEQITQQLQDLFLVMA